MGVNEIDFRGLSASQGLNNGLQMGAALGGMYRNNRIQDQELEQKEAQRMIDDMARDASVALQIQDTAELRAFLQRRVERIRANGGDPSDTIGIMNLPDAQLRQELQRVYARALPSSSFVTKALGNKKFIGSPQKVKDETGSYLVGLVQDQSGNISEERVPIEGEFISTDGLTASERIDQKRAESAASEEGKLVTQIKLQPELIERLETIKQDVMTRSKVKGEERSNARALETYELAMNNLSQALGGTTTGALGWLPALTSASQEAEGALAVMAPIMKSIFRGAGEGTFTDSDQRMLMGMLPTRKDLPDARAAKLQAIDMIVRSKLGSDAPEASQSDKPKDINDLVNKYAN